MIWLPGILSQGGGGYAPTFADNDWTTIIMACQNNEVPDTWAVGDKKNMTINGTSYEIDIIGKNHDEYTDGGTAPLTFQLNKCYTIGYPMNDTDSTSGGWGGCAMRTTHLPTVLAKMPSEVQIGIKNVNKLTSAGNGSSAIQTTADKLFLLSEIEVFGKTDRSHSGEGVCYQYFSDGNSKIKYAGNYTETWWLRSPAKLFSSYFCYVNRGGNSAITSPTSNIYIAPAFCF